MRRTKFIMAHDSRIACFTLSQDGRLIATTSTKGTPVRIFSVVDGTLLQEEIGGERERRGEIRRQMGSPRNFVEHASRVRRGADRAEIYSLAFSENMQWLAVSSDKGTVHVFSLKVNLGLTGNDKPRPSPDLNLGLTGNDKPRPAPDPNIPAASSSLSFIKGVLPKYFNSEWSVAQFRLHEGIQYMVAFVIRRILSSFWGWMEVFTDANLIQTMAEG